MLEGMRKSAISYIKLYYCELQLSIFKFYLVIKYTDIRTPTRQDRSVTAELRLTHQLETINDNPQ
ncbi:hypothetical protein Enr17x_20720 [Gimesia fumaroli]|uniref:Uncharacterized protein n=1 Tax=Gimesia fumaroli TaxID=2527976 RepID=A0A518IA86_9PLAN|nr:hypothetical protein Enr17x_20720 [Gimesia fumaroli]